MNLSDFNYCYLNNIYRTKDVVAFELALADKLFKHCAIYLVDSEHLIEIEKMDDLIKDFKIVDGLLKCTKVLSMQFVLTWKIVFIQKMN